MGFWSNRAWISSQNKQRLNWLVVCLSNCVQLQICLRLFVLPLGNNVKSRGTTLAVAGYDNTANFLMTKYKKVKLYPISSSFVPFKREREVLRRNMRVEVCGFTHDEVSWCVWCRSEVWGCGGESCRQVIFLLRHRYCTAKQNRTRWLSHRFTAEPQSSSWLTSQHFITYFPSGSPCLVSSEQNDSS